MLKIKEFRSEKNMTLDDLASKSKVSKRMISAYEKGENDITLSKLRNIAMALDVDVSTLIGEAVVKKRETEFSTEYLIEENRFLKDQIKIKDNEINRLWALLHGDNKKAG